MCHGACSQQVHATRHGRNACIQALQHTPFLSVYKLLLRSLSPSGLMLIRPCTCDSLGCQPWSHLLKGQPGLCIAMTKIRPSHQGCSKCKCCSKCAAGYVPVLTQAQALLMTLVIVCSTTSTAGWQQVVKAAWDCQFVLLRSYGEVDRWFVRHQQRLACGRRPWMGCAASSLCTGGAWWANVAECSKVRPGIDEARNMDGGTPGCRAGMSAGAAGTPAMAFAASTARREGPLGPCGRWPPPLLSVLASWLGPYAASEAAAASSISLFAARITMACASLASFCASPARHSLGLQRVYSE